MTPTVLLTGGIASGKTFASNYLASLNAHIIDTDIIARSLLTINGHAQSSSILQKLEGYFGGLIFDEGLLNRKKLRSLIFNDTNAKVFLEQLMHPVIFNEVCNRLQRSHDQYNVVVIPLLSKDSKYLELKDFVLVIEVNPKVQLERLMQRDNISCDLALNILDSQVSNQERRELANTIIINTNPVHTQNILKQLDKKYSLAALNEGYGEIIYGL